MQNENSSKAQEAQQYVPYLMQNIGAVVGGVLLLLSQKTRVLVAAQYVVVLADLKKQFKPDKSQLKLFWPETGGLHLPV